MECFLKFQSNEWNVGRIPNQICLIGNREKSNQMNGILFEFQSNEWNIGRNPNRICAIGTVVKFQSQ